MSNHRHGGVGREAYPRAVGVPWLLVTLAVSVVSVIVGLGRRKRAPDLGDPAGPSCPSCARRTHVLDDRCPGCGRGLDPPARVATAERVRGPRLTGLETELLGEYADVHGAVLPPGARGLEVFINGGYVTGGLLRRAAAYYGGIIWPKDPPKRGFPSWEVWGPDAELLVGDIAPWLTGENAGVLRKFVKK